MAIRRFAWAGCPLQSANQHPDTFFAVAAPFLDLFVVVVFELFDPFAFGLAVEQWLRADGRNFAEPQGQECEGGGESQ